MKRTYISYIYIYTVLSAQLLPKVFQINLYLRKQMERLNPFQITCELCKAKSFQLLRVAKPCLLSYIVACTLQKFQAFT